MTHTVMIFRTSFLLALLIGLGGLLGVYPMTPVLRDVHIVCGLIVLVSAIWLCFESRSPLSLIGAVLIAAGGVLPLLSPADPLSVRIFHIVILIVAVGLIEMGVAQRKRAPA